MRFMFFWISSKKSGDETLEEGYIDCPHCRSREPAALTRHVESRSVYFIPISSSEGPERVKCLTCGGYFARNEQTAFGPDRNMPDWNCFKCRQAIPHSQVECPRCGFRFTS